MKFFVCFFLWSILLWCDPAPGMAYDTLRVSVPEENKNGLSVEILQAIAKKMETRLDFLYAPFSRRLYLMKNGTIDLMTGLLKRPEREEYIYFIQPPYRNRSDTTFFVPRGKSALIRTYDDLYPLTIGTTLGSKYFHRFDRDNALNKEPVSDVSFNFKKLLLGRIDTVVFPEGPGIVRIHKMGIADKIEMAQFRFDREKKGYIGISKKSPLMNDIFRVESIIRKMIAAGEIEKIIVAYYTRQHLPIPAH